MKRLKFIPILLISVVVLCTSCSKDPNGFILKINGYWEIQEVTMPDGSKKEYSYNETIDYIMLNDSLIGFRKKLKPGFNNSYQTSEDVEHITAKIEGDSLHLYYKTPYASWKETVIDANETQLKIINQNKAVYLYKRYTSIELNLEE